MDNRVDYLLACLVEECSEIQKDAIKSLRFGLNDHHPVTKIPNRKALRGEFLDLLTIADMLREERVELFNFSSNADMRHMREKREKVERYMQYSRDMGKLSDG